MIHPDTYLKNTHKSLGLFAKRSVERSTILWIADAKNPLVNYLSPDSTLRRLPLPRRAGNYAH